MSDAPPKNFEFVTGVLRTVEAAESLVRRGAGEPGLILYEQLARSCAGARVADELGSLSVQERLERARRVLSDWLRRELDDELVWARRVVRTVRFTAFAIAVIAVLVLLVRSPAEVSRGARWKASSSFSNTPSSGELPRRRWLFAPPNYFFHTNVEHEPWLLVDLGRERTISSVELRNRLDCCRERARGVVIEVGREDGKYRRVATYDESDAAFRDWTARFAPVKARFVRILGTPGESFHLGDVRVFGS